MGGKYGMAKKKSSGSNTGRGSGITEGAATSSVRYNKLVEKVNKLDDVKALKKMIYNRNHSIRKAYEKAHPERAKLKEVVQFPPIEDLRIITQSAFDRINKIKDPKKQVEELRKLIINTTRRRNNPKTTGDFSNREQDYLQNGVNSLVEAIGKWPSTVLKEKLESGLREMTVADMHNIFSSVPSYWAISEGYYYAVTDFDMFIDEIEKILERSGERLTDKERNILSNELFSNDPREQK